jgi:hypothetical protein
VILLPHAASHSTLTVLHPLSGLFIFIRVFVIGEAAVLILYGLLEVLTLLVRQALELIDGGLIAAAANSSVIIAACGDLGCVEGDRLLFPGTGTGTGRVAALVLRSALLSLASLFLLLLLTAGALFVGLIRHEAQNKGLSAVGFFMTRV